MVNRLIVHVDMDAFYAAIEQRDAPELRGQAVVIGGTGTRGVVATCSYEARRFGIHSAMPTARARRLAPEAIYLAPRITHYREVSQVIMAILRDYSDLIEPLSLDEAFLDLRAHGPVTREQALTLASEIKADIWEATSLTCSIGVADNKFLAKLASDLDKPDGITWLPSCRAIETLAPMSVRAIWGVGPKGEQVLSEMGFETVGDLQRASPEVMAQLLGDWGSKLARLARGIDDRPVVAHRERKSIGCESTLGQNIRGYQAVVAELEQRCQRLAVLLESKAKRAGGLRIKVRYDSGFRLATRQAALGIPCRRAETLLQRAIALLADLELEAPIRLVGVAAYDLRDDDEACQIDLFAPPA